MLERGKAIGRAKLRRLQWQSAIAGSDTMLIWLGKNGLGQRDKMAHTDEEGRAVAVEVVHRHRMAACAMIRPGSMNMAKQARLK